jgi:hypothetical protein
VSNYGTPLGGTCSARFDPLRELFAAKLESGEDPSAPRSSSTSTARWWSICGAAGPTRPCLKRAQPPRYRPFG